MGDGSASSSSSASASQFSNLLDLPDHPPPALAPLSPLPPSMNHYGSPTSYWTAAENKQFEIALAEVDEHDPLQWEKITAWVSPGKTVEQVKEHYQRLVDDIERIHSGRIPIPCYVDDPLAAKKSVHDQQTKEKQHEEEEEKNSEEGQKTVQRTKQEH